MSELVQQPLGSTVYFNFTTSVNGVVSSLSNAAVGVYNDNVTQITTGASIAVDYDGVTGLNHVVIDTSSGYTIDTLCSVVLTSGTVGGISLTGFVVGSFQLTSEQTNINKTANAIGCGTSGSGATTTSVPTSALTLAGAAASGVVADQFKGRTMLFNGNTTTAGLRGAASAISANTASNTPTLTVGTLPATPVSGDTFCII